MRPKKEFSIEQREEIQDLYLNTDLNKTEIAKKVGISYIRVSELLKELNITKKDTKAKGVKIPSKRILIDLEKVKKLREELYSFESIALLLDVSTHTIERCIKESNSYIDPLIPANKKLEGRLQEVLDYFFQVNSISATALKFKVTKKVISNLLKYKNIKTSDSLKN